MNKILQLAVFLVVFLPSAGMAQTVGPAATKNVFNAGENFLVTVSIDTQGASVNTVSGKVIVPPQNFAIGEVRSGNSIISLWVEQPKVDPSAGAIVFTGGIPGGYNGSNGTLFSFVAKGKSEGTAAISIADLKILLNDGQGSEVSGPKTTSLSLRFEKMPAAEKIPASAEDNEQTVEQKTAVLPPDGAAPEDFIPVVSRHPSVADNAYFVSFFAVDKSSGIERYEEREVARYLGPFERLFDDVWHEAQSPHVLDKQFWPTRVEIRAYDRAGNSIVGFGYKPAHPGLTIIFIVILMILTVFATRLFSTRRRRANNVKIKR